jgi:hypothetical protein
MINFKSYTKQEKEDNHNTNIMAEKIKIVLEVKFHVTGTTHDGYCSGNDDEDPVDYHYSKEIEVDKKFVREFIEEDGTLDSYKLSKYNKYNTKNCNGSGYCNTKVNHIAISGKLVEKKNLKAKFLAS